MALVSRETLRTQAKERSDMLKSRFISDDEWNRYLNLSAAELYDLMVATAEDYYTIPATLTVNGTDDTFDLPADCYKLVGIDYRLNSLWTPMEKFMFRDRILYQQPYYDYVRYRPMGNNTVMFNPRPPAQDMTLWYVPTCPLMTTDADTFDGINGFEEYIIVNSAIKALVKEESDPSALMAELAQIKQRIIDMAPNRDEGMPEKVTDVVGTRYNQSLVLGFYDGF